jgi:hypothetical protein
VVSHLLVWIWIFGFSGSGLVGFSSVWIVGLSLDLDYPFWFFGFWIFFFIWIGLVGFSSVWIFGLSDIVVLNC